MFLNKLQNIVRSRGRGTLWFIITGDSAGQINNKLSPIRGGPRPRSMSGDVDFHLILAQKKTNPLPTRLRMMQGCLCTKCGS